MGEFSFGGSPVIGGVLIFQSAFPEIPTRCKSIV